jgi:hypothetical protein
MNQINREKKEKGNTNIKGRKNRTGRQGFNSHTISP